MDYHALLKRAREKVPENVGTGERFVLPEAEVIQEGKQTLVRNFGELLDKMNRSSEHAVPLLLRDIGTAGSYDDDNGRLVLQGRVMEKTLNDRIKRYFDTYVVCGECGRPDTHLTKDGRTTVVKCDACGGHRPVKGAKKQQQKQAPPEAVEEGKTYEVMIEDVGKRGDGIARREKYTIFVNGAANKGTVVKAKINRVTGNLAFAEVVHE